MVRVKKFPTADSSAPAATESKQGSSLNGIDCSDRTAEPIDVLEVDGKYYGFSGCHRFEACQRLGKETILARVRKAPRAVLKMHLPEEMPVSPEW